MPLWSERIKQIPSALGERWHIVGRIPCVEAPQTNLRAMATISRRYPSSECQTGLRGRDNRSALDRRRTDCNRYRYHRKYSRPKQNQWGRHQAAVARKLLRQPFGAPPLAHASSAQKRWRPPRSAPGAVGQIGASAQRCSLRTVGRVTKLGSNR